MLQLIASGRRIGLGPGTIAVGYCAQLLWSLGVMISTSSVPSGRGAGSLAWAGLGNTYFWSDPARGVAAVILMQLIPFADPKALGRLDGFEKAVRPALG
jgi:CubicO group peptidase (beta-lactamase class C family)